MKADEGRYLDGLSQAITPPERLKQRIETDLHRHGLIRSKRLPAWFGNHAGSTMVVAALLVLAFLVGYQVGRPGAGPSGSPYLLLLFQDDRFSGESGADLVAEYSRWAAALRRRGNLLDGQKLAKARQRLGTNAATGEVLSGYFHILAEDYDQAVALARTCPHLKYGGTVEIRAIDPTNGQDR